MPEVPNSVPPVGLDASPIVSTPSSTWPHVLLRIGGALIALGALLLGYVTLALPEPDPVVGLTIVLGFGLGGLVMTVGWGGLLARGTAGFAPVLGSLLLAGAFITTSLLPATELWALELAGWIAPLGLVAFAATHYFALGEPPLERLALARFGAVLALIGLGGQLFATSRAIELPEAVLVISAAIGYAGLVALALGLVFGLGPTARSR